MANRERTRLKFSRLIAKGENDKASDGFCGVNVNGTLRAGNFAGWNWNEDGSIGQPTGLLPTDKGGSGYRNRKVAPPQGTRRIGNRTSE